MKYSGRLIKLSVHEPETEKRTKRTPSSRKQIRWLRLDWASLPGARNLGVRESTGDIVLFIDDDVQLPLGYLSAHEVNYHRKGS